LPLPVDGSYIAAVRAADTLGNATPMLTPAARAFTIDTAPPPAPVITTHPDDPTTNQTARFQLADPESGVQFRCRLDGGAFGACGPMVNHNRLAVGDHCFAAVALDAAGNQSGSVTYCWSILIPGSFRVTGSMLGALAPGVTRTVNLVIGNPFNFSIRVTGVTVTVDTASSKAACSGSDNLKVTRSLLGTVDVPARSSRSLQDLGISQADWPTVTMPNLSTNQDACKGATFTLHYTGTATKP
jgi:hypothetical protein